MYILHVTFSSFFSAKVLEVAFLSRHHFLACARRKYSGYALVFTASAIRGSKWDSPILDFQVRMSGSHVVRVPI